MSLRVKFRWLDIRFKPLFAELADAALSDPPPMLDKTGWLGGSQAPYALLATFPHFFAVLPIEAKHALTKTIAFNECLNVASKQIQPTSYRSVVSAILYCTACYMVCCTILKYRARMFGPLALNMDQGLAEQ